MEATCENILPWNNEGGWIVKPCCPPQDIQLEEMFSVDEVLGYIDDAVHDAVLCEDETECKSLKTKLETILKRLGER